MNRFTRYLPVLLALLLGVVFVATRSPKRTHSKNPLTPSDSSGPAESAPMPTSVSKNKPSPPTLTEHLDILFAQLAGSHDGKANRRLLGELRQFLDSIPTEVASRDTQRFLTLNKDAATNLDVTVKPGGQLGDASSLRVFLFDYLGQIDRPAAGVLAAQILSSYTTPDEWAVNLRNYAWANPGTASEGYLQTKSKELLNNPEWVKNPSAGFLEAFDTIVHAHGTMLAPKLAMLVRDKENRATAHAAYLTLDRLAIAEPAAMFKLLIDQSDLMQGREQTRANFLARADVRDVEQRAALEQYLLDPARTAQELTTFAGLYPNANYMISNNLLTPTTSRKREDLVAHDRAALEAVRAWQSDERFANLKPQIETMRVRLETFVQQAATNP